MSVFDTRSSKKKAQQARWQALGTVMGFNGYLANLQHVINATDISAIDKYFLTRDLDTMRNRLAILKEVIRKKNG